jgi:hypothetical protein
VQRKGCKTFCVFNDVLLETMLKKYNKQRECLLVASTLVLPDVQQSTIKNKINKCKRKINKTEKHEK